MLSDSSMTILLWTANTINITWNFDNWHLKRGFLVDGDEQQCWPNVFRTNQEIWCITLVASAIHEVQKFDGYKICCLPFCFNFKWDWIAWLGHVVSSKGVSAVVCHFYFIPFKIKPDPYSHTDIADSGMPFANLRIPWIWCPMITCMTAFNACS